MANDVLQSHHIGIIVTISLPLVASVSITVCVSKEKT